MLARTSPFFHPTAETFGTLTVRPHDAPRARNGLVIAAFLLSLALGLATLYQADQMLFQQTPHVAHGEIFAVDMD